MTRARAAANAIPAARPNEPLFELTERGGLWNPVWPSLGEASDQQKLLAGALQARGYALVKAQMSYGDEMQTAGDRRFALNQVAKYALDGYRLSHNKEHFSFRPDAAARQPTQGTHIPNAVKAYTDSAIGDAGRVMRAVNKSLIYRNVRTRTGTVDKWFGKTNGYQTFSGHCDLSESVLHDRYYHDVAEGEVRAAPHVDRGLLTIISNPNEVEILVGGEWVRPYSHAQFGGQDVVLVLVGYSLEKATNGLLRAALHRVVSQGGTRRSTVLDVRAPSSLQVCPAELTPPPAADDELDEYEVAARAPFVFSQLIENFDATHNSINAPVPPTADPLPALDVAPPARFHPLLSLPLDLLMQLLSEVDSPASMARLASTCAFLHCLTSREEVWVPLAERFRIDWNLALDRVDKGARSIGRATRANVPAQQPAALLQRVRAQWSRLIGAELDPSTHLNEAIDIQVCAQDGNRIYCQVKFGAPLVRLMRAFCQRQGVAMNSVRFLFDGFRFNESQTPFQLEMYNGEVVDVMVEQRGD